jgi:hypothetical protein
MVVGEQQATVRLARPSRLRPQVNWVGVVLGLPLVMAATYLIVLVIDFGSVSSSINSYGDAVIAPVLGKLAGQAAPGSQILLGHHAYYEEYLFLRATSGLPFYRGLWELAPLLWTLLGFALLGWAAWRALGRFAAVLTVSAVVCLGSLGRFSFFALNWHGLSVVHTILIAAALVWLAPRAAEISWPRLALAAGGLGAASAFPVASDPLFLEWAMVPMGVAATMMILRSRGRARRTIGAFTLGTAAVALIGGLVIARVMIGSGVGTTTFSYSLLASPGSILAHLGLLFEGLTALGGGYLFRMSPDLTGILTSLSGLFILGTLAAGLTQGVRLIRPGRSGPAGAQAPTTMIAYVGFWVSSLIVQSLAFAVAGVPRTNLTSARYLLAGFVAIMALLPLLARRGRSWRLAVAGAVAVFGLSSVVQLAQQPYVSFGRYPTAAVAQRVLAFARAEGVHYGYASYWQAPDLTWLTRFKLQIYPIGLGCRGWEFGICPWSGARIDSWYTPRSEGRSMLITDTPDPPGGPVDPWMGAPVAVAQFGTLTVSVYPHDIAYYLSPRGWYSQPVRVASVLRPSTPTRSCPVACS